MKKIMITVATALFVSGINAQSIYDATKIASKDLNGTARFVGMGGAMSALGGDISTMGTNPAGIGIYRSNDAMTSFSFSAFGSESKYKGYDNTYNSKLDKNHWSYDNIGFVISSKIGNQTPLRYVNFGFNYHKSKSFYVHSPTFYKLTLTTSARLISDMYLDGKLKRTDIDTYNLVGDMNREYSLRTPWIYNLSLGYTVGNSFAIGAEYEYEDYSTMRFNYPEGDAMFFENNQTDMLKGVHTFRVGAEYKVIPQFAFRLGYNHSTTAFKGEAYKQLPENSISTDTDFANAQALNNYTLGIGYRGNMFYADLAYKFSSYKEDFYAFDDLYLNKTEVTNTRSQVLFTVGMRF